MITCEYIFPEKYDLLARQAFALVKDYLLLEFEDIQEYQEVGIDKSKEMVNLNKYNYLINYLSKVRNEIDYFISVNSCITEAQIQQFKDLYKIDCLIKKNVCSKWTRQIVDIFFASFPTCDGEITWKWDDFSECVNVGGTLYAVSTTLLKLLNGVVVDTFYVEPDATEDEIKAIAGEEAGGVLYDERFAYPDNGFCCTAVAYDFILLNVGVVSSTQITANWTSNAPEYRVRLLQGSTVVIDTTTDALTYNFTVVAGQTYTVEISASNCAATRIATQTVTVAPYTITIVLEGLAANNLLLSVPLVSTRYYGESFNFRFDDDTAPLYQLTSVLVNGAEFLPEVMFDTIQEGIYTGGVIDFPFISQNLTIQIYALPGSECTVVGLTYIPSIGQLNIIDLE